MIPFTSDQFLNVFARYNVGVWPAQILLYGVAVLAIGLASQRRRDFSRSTSGLLAFLWLWSGIVYHVIFFSRINQAAYLFGAIFVFQSCLFIYAGVSKRKLWFGFEPNSPGIVGGVFFIYALVIYPVLGYMLGHIYPTAPTFGVPCPVTIFTFGILLWSRRRVPAYIMLIPLLWSLVGFSAAWSLGMKEDFGLVVAGVSGFLLIVSAKPKERARCCDAAPRHGNPMRPVVLMRVTKPV